MKGVLWVVWVGSADTLLIFMTCIKKNIQQKTYLVPVRVFTLVIVSASSG